MQRLRLTTVLSVHNPTKPKTNDEKTNYNFTPGLPGIQL
jgi:hypothetical protein